MVFKKSYFNLDNNDKLVINSFEDSKNIANKILNESNKLINESKNEILSKKYSEEKSKVSLADGEIIYELVYMKS